MSNFVWGTLAAGISPLFMTLGFVFWDKNWTSSAYNLNLFKCSLASVGFLITVISIDRMRALEDSTAVVHWAMFLSSMIGIVVGDNTWLMALERLGARRVIMVDSLKPFCGALLGAYLLKETIRSPALFFSGMALTVLGVVICALEQKKDSDDKEPTGCKREYKTESKTETEREAGADKDGKGTRKRQEKRNQNGDDDMRVAWGYVLAVVNVLLDAAGFVITKHYGPKLNTFDINLLRFGEASAALALGYGLNKGVAHWFALLDTEGEETATDPAEKGEEDATCRVACFEISFGQQQQKREQGKENEGEDYLWGMGLRALGFISLGVLFVTYLCPALTNYALFQIPLGLVLTLTSLGPIYSLPLVRWLKKETITHTALLSAVVAVVGVVLVVWGAY